MVLDPLGDAWFAVLPDGRAGRAAARALRPRVDRVVAHGSGRPWLLGRWPRDQVVRPRRVPRGWR
ncbi:hypothetical protein ACTWP5_11345 [Streptomyces sp. 4N509B]|uniref:hypothetical protein n=1 Tax=Streptomyces sp. 4N509B TaxID=3457413 RepID=UPI003FD6BDCB